MSDGVQISNAAPKVSSAASDGKPTLRDQIVSAYNSVMGNTGNPLEGQYNPLQAATIGAGAAATAGVNQLKQLYQQGVGALAGRSNDPTMQAEAARMRVLADQTRQQGQEEAQLYQPMQEAFPYATGLGEAAPAVVPGGMAAMRSAAGFNAGRAYLDEMARATKSAQLAALVKALKGY